MPRLNEETGLKECSKCREHKPAEMFSKRNNYNDGLASACKKCISDKKLNLKYEIDRNIFEKQCISCKEIKYVSLFAINRSNKDGYTAKCKKCIAEYESKFNFEIDLNIRSKICTICKILKPISEFNTYKKSKNGYRAACKECCRNAISIKTKLNKYKKERAKLQDDVKLKLIVRIRARLRSFMKANGLTKNYAIMTALSCTKAEFKRHLELRFYNEMSWDNMKVWHIDHFIPLSVGITESDIFSLSHYTNLQPMLAIDNLKKGDTIPSKDEVLEFFKDAPDSPALKLYLERFDNIEVLVQNK